MNYEIERSKILGIFLANVWLSKLLLLHLPNSIGTTYIIYLFFSASFHHHPTIDHDNVSTMRMLLLLFTLFCIF